jgi:thioredoxin 2
MGLELMAVETADKTATSTVLLACGACGAKNPTPASELTTPRRCVVCDATLTPLTAPLDVDVDVLVAVVSAARVPVLIDFWAPWCPSCRLAGPIVKKVAQDIEGRASASTSFFVTS